MNNFSMDEVMEAYEVIVGYLKQLLEIQNTTNTVVYAFIAIFSLVACFFGYKLIKVWSSIIGGIVGFFFSVPICAILGSQVGGVGTSTIIPIIILIVLAFILLGGFLAFKIYKVGVAVVSGFFPSIIILLSVDANEGGVLLALMVFSIFAVIGFLLTRPYIIAVTSISNGFIAGNAILRTFKVNNLGASILVGAVLVALGFIYQWKTTKVTEKTQNLEQAKGSATYHIKGNSIALALIPGVVIPFLNAMIKNALYLSGTLLFFTILIILLGIVHSFIFVNSFRLIESGNRKGYLAFISVFTTVFFIVTLISPFLMGARNMIITAGMLQSFLPLIITQIVNKLKNKKLIIRMAVMATGIILNAILMPSPYFIPGYILAAVLTCMGVLVAAKRIEKAEIEQTVMDKEFSEEK